MQRYSWVFHRHAALREYNGAAPLFVAGQHTCTHRSRLARPSWLLEWGPAAQPTCCRKLQQKSSGVRMRTHTHTHSAQTKNAQVNWGGGGVAILGEERSGDERDVGSRPTLNASCQQNIVVKAERNGLAIQRRTGQAKDDSKQRSTRNERCYCRGKDVQNCRRSAAARLCLWALTKQNRQAPVFVRAASGYCWWFAAGGIEGVGIAAAVGLLPGLIQDRAADRAAQGWRLLRWLRGGRYSQAVLCRPPPPHTHTHNHSDSPPSDARRAQEFSCHLWVGTGVWVWMVSARSVSTKRSINKRSWAPLRKATIAQPLIVNESLTRRWACGPVPPPDSRRSQAELAEWRAGIRAATLLLSPAPPRSAMPRPWTSARSWRLHHPPKMTQAHPLTLPYA